MAICTRRFTHMWYFYPCLFKSFQPLFLFPTTQPPPYSARSNTSPSILADANRSRPSVRSATIYRGAAGSTNSEREYRHITATTDFSFPHTLSIIFTKLLFVTGRCDSVLRNNTMLSSKCQPLLPFNAAVGLQQPKSYLDALPPRRWHQTIPEAPPPEGPNSTVCTLPVARARRDRRTGGGTGVRMRFFSGSGCRYSMFDHIF